MPSRFQGNFDAAVSYVDPKSGRNIYFVERPTSTFQYIFDYIVSGNYFDVPSFQENPSLIRNLRKEAEFFGLEGFLYQLKITKTFIPNSGEGDKGILYWLGTNKGTNTTYQNPFTIGSIHVGGWVDDESNDIDEFAASATSRANYVEYRAPLSFEIIQNHHLRAIQKLSWCEHAIKRLPIVLDLKSISVRPSHYSLRATTCYGMAGDWNFEGSLDGNDWDVLHAARSDGNLDFSVHNDHDATKLSVKLGELYDTVENESEEEQCKAIVNMVETEFRHTWELTPPPTKFYRYFRIIGAMPLDYDGENFCLHGEGIELFGDVYEE